MMESLGSDSLEPLQIQRQSPGPLTWCSDQEQLDSTVEARRLLAPTGPESVTQHAQSDPRRPAVHLSDASPAASLRREIALWRSDRLATSSSAPPSLRLTRRLSR